MVSQPRDASGRFVALTITANTTGYTAGLSTAAAAVGNFAMRHEQNMTRAGTAVAAFGAAAAAGLLLSAREAIQWESAWAGVSKTVDGSTSQMAALEDELRSMAKTLPATHQEIAAVAEAAGQLGIKREDIAGFTKVMVDLGVSTNLTSDQAATALARFSNIMGTSASDVDRLGSALVALGNDGASTEGEIVTMALRIAGAGRSLGLTEGEVLGFANTLSSLGIEAEAGGTAISTVMLKIQQATDGGGDALEKIARVAGVSAQDFKAAFETDAAGAIVMFTEGLDRADKAGENTTGIMADLGFEGIRVTDTLRRLASGGDLLSDSLELGNSAWAENRALVDEANKRYETTASKLAVARNNLRDTAITIGDQLLPAIQAGADGFAKFAAFIGGMDPALLGFFTNMTGMVGVVGLVGGALLLVVPQIAATIAAMQALAAAAPRTAAALGLLAKTAGVVVALYAVGSAIGAIKNASLDAVPSIEATTQALLDFRETQNADELNALFEGLRTGKRGFDDFAGAVERITEKDWQNKINDFGDGIFGITTDADRASEAIAGIDAALAQMVAGGNGDQATEIVAGLAEQLGGGQEAVDLLTKLLPGYSDAQLAASRAQEEAATSSEAMALGVAGVTQTSEEAQKAVDALTQALDALFQQTFSVEEATDAYASSLNALRQSAVDNGTSITGNTEAQLANREALRSATDAAFGVISAMVEQGASADDVASRTAKLKQQLYDTAIQAGFSEEAAARYAGALDNIPATAQTTIGLNGAAAAIDTMDRLLSKVVSFDGRTATATIRTINSVTNRVSTQTTRMEADGGFYPRAAFSYADGGEHHVAQIAPAGSWRVWAEDETGGEAYIPLAQAKRGRSVAITRDVADRFGYDLVPRQATRFVDGGIATTSRATVPAASLTGLAIEGTLDLGNGLVGLVRGVVREENSTVGRAVASGRR